MRDEASPGPRIAGHHTHDNSARTVAEGAAILCAPVAELPRLIVGARLVPVNSPVEWLALPMDRTAHAQLTISLGKRRAPKGECHLRLAEIVEQADGMQLIALPPDPLTPVGEGTAEPEVAQSFLRRIASGSSHEEPEDPAPKKRSRSLAE